MKGGKYEETGGGKGSRGDRGKAYGGPSLDWTEFRGARRGERVSAGVYKNLWFPRGSQTEPPDDGAEGSRMGFDLDVTADGRYIVAGSGMMIATGTHADHQSVNVSQSSVRVFDATTGKECYRWEVDKGIIPYVSISPDGRYVATSSEKGVVVYRTPKAVWVKSTGQKKKAKRGKSMK